MLGWREVTTRGGPETWYVAEKVSWVLIEIRNRWKGKGQFISSLLNPPSSSMVRFSGLTDKNHWLHVLWQMWHHLYPRSAARISVQLCDPGFSLPFLIFSYLKQNCLKIKQLLLLWSVLQRQSSDWMCDSHKIRRWNLQLHSWRETVLCNPSAASSTW